MTTLAGEAPLELVDLEGGYPGGISILHGVSMKVYGGEIVAVVGPNGSGKSTLAKSVLGVAQVTGGRVRVRGSDLKAKEPADVVALGVGYVPQSGGVFPAMSVRRCLELGGWRIRDRKLVEQRIETVFGLFPSLAGKERVTSGLLSGGEQRMLAMGVCLMSDPEIVILDEPSAGLAGKRVADLMECVAALVSDGRRAVLLVEQNVRAALTIARRVYVMREGRVAGEFDAEELLSRDDFWDLL